MSTRYSGSPHREASRRTYITPPGPADIVIPTVDLSYFSGYKSLGTKEYITAFGITALAELILDRVLIEMPDNPLPLMSKVCKEWQDKAAAEADKLYGEHSMTRRRSPSPGASAASGGVGAPTHPPPLPWTEQRPYVPPANALPAASSFRNPQTNQFPSYWANGSAAPKNTAGFTYASKDYIQRQRIACVLDEWLFSITNHKPYSPALFSFNYFKQRTQMRAAVKQEEELGTQLTLEERVAAQAIRNRMHNGGTTPPPPGSGSATPPEMVATLRRGATARSPLLPPPQTSGFGLHAPTQAEVAASVAKRSSNETPVGLGNSNKSATPIDTKLSAGARTNMSTPVATRTASTPTPIPTPTPGAVPAVAEVVEQRSTPAPATPHEEATVAVGDPLLPINDRAGSIGMGGVSPFTEISARTSPGLPLEGNASAMNMSHSPTAPPAAPNEVFPGVAASDVTEVNIVANDDLGANDYEISMASGAFAEEGSGVPLSEAIVL